MIDLSTNKKTRVKYWYTQPASHKLLVGNVVIVHPTRYCSAIPVGIIDPRPYGRQSVKRKTDVATGGDLHGHFSDDSDIVCCHQSHPNQEIGRASCRERG